jgi:CheY-like chemotaxis protein
VEDNVENQEIAKELLEKVGVRVTIANNGKEALRMLDEMLFDSVLMDCQMPVMDGLEATRILRYEKHMVAVPVIAMTANVMQEDIERYIKAGMSDFVAKPIDVKLFYATLLKWVKPKNEVLLQEDNRVIKDRANLYALNIDGVDIDKALECVANDEEMLFGMLKRFAASQKDAMQKIFEMHENGNVAELQRAVHTLKGLCGNIEVAALYEGLKNVESAIKEESVNSDALVSMLREIDEELKGVIASIEENFEQFVPEETKEEAGASSALELQADIDALQHYFANFDSEAIHASQELAQKLSKYLPKETIEPMLKASLHFDFEVAAAALEVIAKELSTEQMHKE